MKFLTKYPFLSAGFVQAAIALAVALGFNLTAGQTGAIEAAAAAVLALAVAPHVDPFPVPLFIGALTAVGALLVAFGVHGVTSAEVSAVVAAISALLGTQGHATVNNKAFAAERGARL
jgi:hypothetical protein